MITANKIQKFVNGIYSDMIKYFYELCNEYNLNKDWNRFILYDAIYSNSDIDEIRKSNMRNKMLTYASVYGDPKSKNINTDDCIIIEIDQTIYMSYQAYYEIIIGCLMEYDSIVESLKFTLKHEIGHILCNRNYIGRPVKEWYEKIDEYPLDYPPKFRKNASMENRLKWVLEYNKIPEEAAANSMVGITEEDIIKDFYRTNGW